MLKASLTLRQEFPFIVDVRGMGLLLGIEFAMDVGPIVQDFLAEGVILYASKGNVVRLLPPLIIEKEEVDIFLEIAHKIFERQNSPMKRDFRKLLDITGEECAHLLERALFMKRARRAHEAYKPLQDRTLAMIFEKASTRTRISFEVAIKELGGHAMFLSQSDTQMGRGEPIRDTARVLSRYVHAIMIRTFAQDTVESLARWASIPVINGLSDLYHPCQILADLFTVKEYKGRLQDVKIAWVGDGNNMANSWIEASLLFGFPLVVATPPAYGPHEAARERGAGEGCAYPGCRPLRGGEGSRRGKHGCVDQHGHGGGKRGATKGVCIIPRRRRADEGRKTGCNRDALPAGPQG